MINFSIIPERHVIGKLLRFPLRCIPNSAEVPILQGPLRGKKWIAGASNHGCWLGSYELCKQKRIRDLVHPGMTCFDIGANVGFYTLLFATLTGPEGIVVAFEPLPSNCRILQQHIEINGYQNVVVQEIALSNMNGETGFMAGDSNSTGHLATTGELRVKCCRLDTLIEEGRTPAPHVIKLDVEGSEQFVLEGAMGLIRRHKPTIFVATHGPEAHRQCCRQLSGIGYAIQAVDGRQVDSTDELVAIPL